MAKYVDFVPDVYSALTTNGTVQIWWFPAQFSQSRLGDRLVGSNACTLIAVLLAGKIDEFSICLFGHEDQPLNRILVSSIAEAIIEGNEIHESLRETNEMIDPNLTVPEAIRAIEHKYPFITEWTDKTRTIFTPLGESFADSIEPPLFDWIHNPPYNKKPSSDLFIVLVADTRSVLFMYQSTTRKISVIDSHNHVEEDAGAVVASSYIGDLENLCHWFCSMCRRSFGRGNSISPYELAFIYSRIPSTNR